MLQRIDHIVIAVRDLARASADFTRAGFTVIAGGEHASGDTHNALITFSDGSYFELIAFKQPDTPQPHRWWAKLKKGEGLVDFALGSDDLNGEVERLRNGNLEVEGPIDGGRQRPDGVQLAWRTILLATAANPSLPFVIQDVTDRSLRVPASSTDSHPLGMTHVDGIVVAVSDLNASVAAFSTALDSRGAARDSVIPGTDAAYRFVVGKQWIDLVQPDDTASDLKQHLNRRGDGPYEIVLGGVGISPKANQLLPADATHGARIRIGH